MPMPLEGLRVIDWTIWQQGPVASAMLGDLGAEVIKLESKDGGDPGRGLVAIAGQSGRLNFYFEANNRNKQSLALDLKQPEAREIVYRLAAVSDVFVQNFRKGVADRLGLGAAELRARNPRLIYANATGYGPEGPESGDPSFDHLGLARSGIMFAAGEPDMPPQAIGGGIADQMGAVLLAYGVLAAVISRERYGVGQVVDASHLGSMSFLQGLSLTSRLINGAAFPRVPRARAFNPLWNHYCCSDDKWIALAMLQPDRYWADFARALGRPELRRPALRDDGNASGQLWALIQILDSVFASRPRAEWLDILRKGGDFIFTVVNSLNDLPNDPQMLANDYIIDFEHPTHGKTQYVGIPVRLSETPGGSARPRPSTASTRSSCSPSCSAIAGTRSRDCASAG